MSIDEFHKAVDEAEPFQVNEPPSWEEARKKIEEIPEGDDRMFLEVFLDLEKSGIDAIDLTRVKKLIKKRSGLTQGDLNDLVKAAKAQERKPDLTHHDMATKLANDIAQETGSRPVSIGGTTWTVDTSGVWINRENISVEVATRFNAEPRCSRGGDYRAITDHMYAITEDSEYFHNAPIGVTCPDYFYRILDDGKIISEHLTADHRQQVRLPVEPSNDQAPMWDAFLARIFDGSEEQIVMLQEVMGAVLFLLMPSLQRAVLKKGAPASGKSTLARILEALIPEQFRGSTDPFKWDQEYFLAALANKRLNIVGELPDDKPIPANIFKQVIGGDTLEGRHPAQRPFTFRNTAAHWFNSNHYIFTKERSDAFWRRWICFEFKNVIPENERIPDFDQKLIKAELPQILAWTMVGAQRIVQRGGRVELTDTHHRMIGEWKNNSSSVREFLNDPDAVTIENGFRTKRSHLYRRYKTWCGDSNFKPISKPGFYREIERAGDIGVGLAEINGQRYAMGISPIGDEW